MAHGAKTVAKGVAGLSLAGLFWGIVIVCVVLQVPVQHPGQDDEPYV